MATVSTQQLVGREEELDALLALLDAREELPSAALLAGEAGIGKTALSLAAVEAERRALEAALHPADAQQAPVEEHVIAVAFLSTAGAGRR